MASIRPIVFLHIPKTGGMSFQQVVVRQYPAGSVRRVAGSLRANVRELQALPGDVRAGIRCLYGHVPFGLHACLVGPATYVTLLRDPVERLVSAYYYTLLRPEWSGHEEILRGKLSLYDWARSSLAVPFHNAQVRILSGAEGDSTSADLLEQAKANISQCFGLVGLTDRFDETLLLCRRLFGWKNVYYGKHNVNRRRPKLAEVPFAAITAIARANAADRALVADVREQFARIVLAQSGFERELAQFRRRNRVYNLAFRLRHLPVHAARHIATAIERARIRSHLSRT